MLVLANDQAAVGFDTGDRRIVDLDDETITRTLEKCHDGSVSALVQLSNSCLMSSGGQDGFIKIWNLENNTLIQSLPSYPDKRIYSLSISPEQKLLAFAIGYKTIKICKLKRN